MKLLLRCKAQTYIYLLGVVLNFNIKTCFAQETSAGAILQSITHSDLQFTPLKSDSEIKNNLYPALSPNEIPQIEIVGSKFIINRVQFKGNLKVNTNQLQTLFKPYLNKPITFNQLKNATDEITLYYTKHGLLVRVILPGQDITDGELTIQILEATLGKVWIENESKRIDSSRVEAWVHKAVPDSSSLSLKGIDRALLLLNDQPEIQVTGTLKPGSETGETNLILVVTDKPLLEGVVGIDNFGQGSTGLNRGTGNLSLNSPFGQGEKLNLYTVHTDGSNYGRLSATAPFGENGLRIGVNSSYLDYKLISRIFTPLMANGTSTTAGAEVSYPIVRSQGANLYMLVNYNYSRFSNYANGEVTNQYHTSVFQGGLNGNKFDNIAGGGINSGSLNISAGQINLNESPSLTADSIGPQINGSFTKLRYAANRQQSINNKVTANFGTSGQISSKNMDSSEQFYLGGPYGVRAYSSGEGNASQGSLSSMELMVGLNSNSTLTGFYDYASIQTFKNSNTLGAPLDNSYSLKGIGTSIGWTSQVGLNLKATWARQIGSLPVSVFQLINSSSGKCCSRIWLNAAYYF